MKKPKRKNRKSGAAVRSSERVNRRRGGDGLYKSPDAATIEDGFGSVWSAWCCMCGRKSMHVCRPGKVQCGHCG